MADLTGVRKSAVLLLSLSQDEAAEILKRLPPEAVEEVSREIASIGEVAVASRVAGLRRVLQSRPGQYLSQSKAGLEYAKALLPKVAERRRTPSASSSR